MGTGMDKRNPTTGGRMLQELAFEVTDRQRLKVPTEKAARLTDRGVRRIFCVLVKQKRVMEWSKAIRDWEMLPVDAEITDRCLLHPLGVRSVRGLVDAASADNQVAAALLRRGTPVLVEALAAQKTEGKAEGRAEGRIEGKAEGRIEGLRAGCLVVLRARLGAQAAAFEPRVTALADLDALECLLAELGRARTVVQLKRLFDRPARASRPRRKR
jgi:hypothetical protein